jgi:hypothetical protein
VSKSAVRPPRFISRGYKGFFLWGVKWLGYAADHSSLSNAEVKYVWCVCLKAHQCWWIFMPSMCWTILQFPHIFMVCLIKHRDVLTFTYPESFIHDLSP